MINVMEFESEAQAKQSLKPGITVKSMSNWPEYEFAVAQDCEDLCVHCGIVEGVVTSFRMPASNCPTSKGNCPS